MGSGSAQVDQLIACLALDAQGSDVFLGDPGPGEGRLFGGMVAAQCVIAAGRTLDFAERPLHSLHAYFLRPGRHDEPIRFVVDRIRDGRTFTTRRVVAHQSGEAIFNMSASFARPETGITHQEPMPDAPPPEQCLDWEEVRARAMGTRVRRDSAVEVRVGDADGGTDGIPREPRQRNWLRLRGELPDDPLLHTAALVYATDRTLLGTAARAHGLSWGRRIAASLDHAVWIHHPVSMSDAWLLYASESPVAHAARGLIFGGLFRTDGTRIASVAQEALIRIADPASH